MKIYRGVIKSIELRSIVNNNVVKLNHKPGIEDRVNTEIIHSKPRSSKLSINSIVNK